MAKSETTQVVQALRKYYPLEILLKITQLARSMFFYHLKPKIDKNAGLRLKIVAIKQENPQ